MKDEREIEKLLERFSPQPAPRELRAKVLQAARREAEARLVLTPAWRWVLAAGSVLLAFVILADWRVSATEQARLNSLLNLDGTRTTSPERAADEKAREVLACLPDLDPASRQALRQFFLKDRGATGQTQRSATRPTEGINEY